MVADLRRRLAAAHAILLARRAGGAGGVFAILPGESNEAALARAEAEGRSGGLLFMPGPAADAEAWERETAADQQRLLREAEQHLLDLAYRP